jgi:predicted ATPase
MIRKIKINNYKCIVDLDLDFSSTPTALLVGKNATGKSVIGDVLSIFQTIGQQHGHTRDLIHQKDFSFGNISNDMSFELVVELDTHVYEYCISFEWPQGFRDARIKFEKLSQDKTVVFSRERAAVDFEEKKFTIDWHLIALSTLFIEKNSPIDLFRKWLARIVVIAPIPFLMNGMSTNETVKLNRTASNFADWFFNTLTRDTSTVQIVQDNIKAIFDDFSKIEFQPFNENSRKIIIHFLNEDKKWSVDFELMSSGEKCLILCAGLIASAQVEGPFACFWDEPDNYLALGEIGHLIVNLRRSFHQQGFLLVASHNQQTIKYFSSQNTFVTHRENHMMSTKISLLENTSFKDHLIESMILGDVFL